MWSIKDSDILPEVFDCSLSLLVKCDPSPDVTSLFALYEEDISVKDFHIVNDDLFNSEESSISYLRWLVKFLRTLDSLTYSLESMTVCLVNDLSSRRHVSPLYYNSSSFHHPSVLDVGEIHIEIIHAGLAVCEHLDERTEPG